MSQPEGLPDWKDSGAYGRLLRVGRTGFAWEWLRRDPAYRMASREQSGEPEAWGLHAYEDAAKAAPEARPMWTRSATPFVLQAAADPSKGRHRKSDLFDVLSLAPLSTLMSACGAERLLLSDGYRTIRLDVLRGTLGNGPVLLRYDLSGLSGAEAPLMVLRQFLHLVRTGRFSGPLHRPERKAARWILLLRTADALAAGARQRDIAAELLDATAMRTRWRTEDPSLRSRVQRLAREAARMAGGYRHPAGERDPRRE